MQTTKLISRTIFFAALAVVFALMASQNVGAQSLRTILKEQIRSGAYKDSLTTRRPSSGTSEKKSRAVAMAASHYGKTRSNARTTVHGSRMSDRRPQNPGELFAYCRQRVHMKYGWNGHDGKVYLFADHSLQLTEHCVANHGRVD
jgi:hypothetical protein